MKEINIKFNNQNNPALENSYRKLRRNIQLSDNENKVIIFTSCSADVDKSSVALNLARSMAENGKRVLFIDADLRNSVLVGRQRIRGHINGLSHYLTGECKLEDIIYITNIDKLSMIFPGEVEAEPAELFDGKLFRTLVPCLKSIYDYIIIDAPALDEENDTSIIAQSADSAVIVIGSGTVSGREAKYAIAQLTKTGCEILGVVLDKAGKKKSYAEQIGIGIIAVLAVVVIISLLVRDKKGPKISFPSDVVYSAENAEAALWDGVTAYDSKDGDVSASLMIDDYVIIDDGANVKVTYVAKDKSNNVTWAERIMPYKSGSSQGNIQGSNEQETEPNTENQVVENETTTEAPSQSETESQTEPEPTTEAVETAPATPDQKPVLVLKSAEATIAKGEKFKVFEYVYDITDDRDTRSDLFKQICIDGFYDTSVAGNYEIYIYCVDSGKNSSNREKFILHVN